MEGESCVVIRDWDTQDEAGPSPKRAKHDTSLLSDDLQHEEYLSRFLADLCDLRRSVAPYKLIPSSLTMKTRQYSLDEPSRDPVREEETQEEASPSSPKRAKQATQISEVLEHPSKEDIELHTRWKLLEDPSKEDIELHTRRKRFLRLQKELKDLNFRRKMVERILKLNSCDNETMVERILKLNSCDNETKRLMGLRLQAAALGGSSTRNGETKWLEKGLGLQAGARGGSSTRNGETKQYLDDKILREIAERLGGDWVKLALELNIDMTKVHNTESKYPNDPTRQGLEMLLMWKRDQCISAEGQYEQLYTALKNIGRKDIAGFLYEPHLDDFTLLGTAVELDDDWKPLAVDELGFTKSKVETIEQKYEEIPRQGYEMLKTWKQDQPTSVELQVDTLCTALKNIGRADVAGFLNDRIRLPRVMNKTLIA